MKTPRWALAALLVIAGCGGLATSPEKSGGDATQTPSSNASGAPGASAPLTPHAPKSHRAAPVDCPATDASDGGADAGARCTTDSECGGTVCECGQDFECFGPKRNVCLTRGNCLVDSDCGPAGYCSFSSDGAYCGLYRPAGYFCHTPQDTCADDTDCPRQDYGPYSCQFLAESGAWMCLPAGP